MKFIKLTNRNNKTVYVNMENVVEMRSNNSHYDKYTKLYSGNMCFYPHNSEYGEIECFTIEVLETPEEIMQMIM